VVGFWGTLVLARSATPLAELLADVAERVEPAGEYADGWQVVRFGRALEVPLLGDEVGERTGFPVIAGGVADSDYVDLRVIGETRWKTTLCRQSGYSYVAHYLQQANGLRGAELEAETEAMLGRSAGEAAALLVRWAAATGRVVPLDPLVETLEADADPFAEDRFYELVDRLALNRPATDSAGCSG